MSEAVTLRPFRVINDLVSAGEFAAAEEETRRWIALRGAEGAVLGSVGAVFIDIGNYTGRLALVREGVELTRRAMAIAASRELAYNLANGLSRLLPETLDAVVNVAPDPLLTEALALYYEAIDSADGTEPAPAFNLASVLARAGRSIEGLDLVRETLAKYPEHGRGWATLGDILSSVWSFYGRYPDLLQDAIGAYRQALVYETADLPFRERIASRIAWADAHLDEEQTHPHPDLRDARRTPASLLVDCDPWDEDLSAFVWKAGLALNLCSGCRVDSPAAYDRYPLPGILVDPSSKAASERTPAEVNVLLQGFIGARGLLWLSRAKASAEVEILSWPVGGLAFSRRSSYLAASFREAYGVFDRIAAVLNAQLKVLPEEPYFDKLFFDKKDKQLVFRATSPWPESVGLRALMYLSASFERDNGRFANLRDLRNKLQHSLVLPGVVDASFGWPWRSVPDDDLERSTLQMLRLTRAAIIYCCEYLKTAEAGRLRDLRKRGEVVVQTPGPGVNRA